MGNMKANRKFVKGEDAVSAVIGVILMVAITVAIAATVYVYVSGMLSTQGPVGENAAATVEGKTNYIKVTLTKVGSSYPAAGYLAADCKIFVNGTLVANQPANWLSGQPLMIVGNGAGGFSVTAALPPTAPNMLLAAGIKCDVSVSIRGTVVGSGTATIS